MRLSSLIKRGFNLVKVGKAVHSLKRATEADQREWARHYLVEILGKSRGLPTKVGQFMTLNGDAGLQNKFKESIPPMPYEQVIELLECAYGAPWDTVFCSIEKTGRPASLGQVHFGKLPDGSDVAVKIQYPEISHSVETEMTLLGWMPKVGPAARWGFNLEGYRDAFWNSFSRELDYTLEMKHQSNYRNRVKALPNVTIPEVVAEMCRPMVLVQRREEGFSLEEAERMTSSQKQAIGRVLLEHYLFMLFRQGMIHSDPNPENFAFRKKGRDGFELIVYDFGSVLEISRDVRLALIRTILALREHESLDPVSCLTAIGFDQKKLEDLRPTLPALLNVLFDPFICEAPYEIHSWKLSERFDRIVGDLKWWFRSAAPPELIFLMRTLHGMVIMLERLDAKLPWKFIMDQLCSEEYPAARAIRLPEVKPAVVKAPGFDGISKYLQIHVAKSNGNKVRLTMPARVSEELEEVIDPPVRESIQRQNIDLQAIQDRVRKSGYIPQTLFELKDSEREVRVWLE